MLLDKINSPQDLKKITLEQLPQLASEIRARIVEVVAQNGGHLASSLGAVELIIALHYCLDTPRDKIIFDVGHQAYAHKILTGRNKDFSSLRQHQGLSGFPSKEESVYDMFTTGHSSTAVSLALGLACARDYNPDQGEYFKVVAVIGDGSLSGGLCFEGLNNAGHLKKDLLVILNTNELSIAPNVGALSTYLNRIISLPIYNRFKNSLENFVGSRIPKGSRLLKIANKFEKGLKELFIPGIFFEELGFRYLGPLDGHNIGVLVTTLRNIKNNREPILLHVITKKGKGYPIAENEPVKFHGTGPFDIKTGLNLSLKQVVPLRTYTEVFSEKLLELAKAEEKIIAVTAAMPEGTGLDKFRNCLPKRFFDVGIAEAHAVCFSAGLARLGFKPVVAIYSTFLQRAYDQIIQDIALQNLSVILAIDRAGIVGEDGVTHQGIFDIAFLRSIPNFMIMAPKDGPELERMLEFALRHIGPVAIRYPKSVIPHFGFAQCPSKKCLEPVEGLSRYPLPGRQAGATPLELGKAEILEEGKDFALLALGSMVEPCCGAIALLKKEGLSGTLINARFVKPLDLELFKRLLEKVKFVFSAEEGIIEGGFGSAIAEAINSPVIKIGLPGTFIPHGARDLLLDKYGLNAQGIADRIKSVIHA